MINNTELEDLYKQGKKPFGETPNAYYNDALTFLKPGTVLDLGGGYGRFSLHFAQLGFDVTNVDISKDALDKFKDNLQDLGLTAKAVLHDITTFPFTESYDNIVCVTTLHLINKKEALQLLEKIKSHTVLYGINFITGFLKNHNSLFSEEMLPGNDFLISYCNWQILYYKRFMAFTIEGKKLEYFILVAKKTK